MTARTNRRHISWRSEAALLGASLAAGIGATRLVEHPLSARVAVPVLTAVLVGHLAAALTKRFGGLEHEALAASAVAVVLADLWSVDARATTWGLPTRSTLHVLATQLGAEHQAVASSSTPVPALPGVVLLLAFAAGLVAAFSRVLRGDTRGTPRHGGGLVPLLPSFALFVYASLLSSGVGRVPATFAYLGGALLYLAFRDPPIVHGVKVVGMRRPSFEALAGRAVPDVVAAGAVALASTGLSGMRLSAFAARSGGSAGTGGQGGLAPAGGQVTTLDLVDNVRALDVSGTSNVMFTATSSADMTGQRVATYWQVGTLTRFDGSAWLPVGDEARLAGGDRAEQAAATPPALPGPESGPTFTASVTIGALATRLLPVPPLTTSILALGLPHGRLRPGVGLVTRERTATGLGYTVAALEPPDPGQIARQAGAGASLPASELAPYLALPPMPKVVSEIAQQAIGGAKTSVAKAEALEAFFRTGVFRYTFDPPAVRGDPLVWFLTVTHAGFCQQFAGAYAVLARLVGLPTRVAIGFTPGTTDDYGFSVVTGQDAHVWPEVYLGSTLGWVSFEPTPGGPAGEPRAWGVVGALGGPVPGGAQQPVQMTPETKPSGAPRALRRVPGATAASRPGGRAAAWTGWGALLGAGGAVVVVVGGTFLAWRRRRGSRWSVGRGRTPGSVVVRAYESAAAAFRRTGLERRPAETPLEHASRIAEPGRHAWLGVPAGADEYGQLAELATRAVYGRDDCTSDEAERAVVLAGTVRSAQSRRALRFRT
jgi:transglutaminase-like putative cysteine protease